LSQFFEGSFLVTAANVGEWSTQTFFHIR